MPVCKNCSAPLQGPYCAQCGQRDQLERIGWSYVVHSVVHFFTHLDRGFFHTSVAMIKDPGSVVIRFLEGKRQPYHKPISYFLIWAAVTILSFMGSEALFGKDTAILFSQYYGTEKASEFALHNLTTILAVIIPVLSLYFWMICSAFRYNFIESLVGVLYIVGTILLLQSAFIILASLFYAMTGIRSDLELSDPQKVIYLAWFGISFLPKFPVGHKWLRAVAFVLLSFGSFTLWRLVLYPWLAEHIL
ncbi:MAG TPA: DUF3667 domain-containing protein [Saprospiraceae bacterium]|nr:DUF3667 domain-containing protein [Saprospiraceae bacterium]